MYCKRNLKSGILIRLIVSVNIDGVDLKLYHQLGFDGCSPPDISGEQCCEFRAPLTDVSVVSGQPFSWSIMKAISLTDISVLIRANVLVCFVVTRSQYLLSLQDGLCHSNREELLNQNSTGYMPVTELPSQHPWNIRAHLSHRDSRKTQRT
ncbi:hypothetical protein RRG08_045141 [Elysia crispata]|uniref:Uncharacterized protein n=1 Tax=Elysia crispata TaxID=231223 RepID=A0AAE1D4M3_9GAST|nr:hypothetical protein RRG08_045141 [Elysia crispata]